MTEKIENNVVAYVDELVDDSIFEHKNNKRVHNNRIPKESKTKVYCQDDYAEDLYSLYTGQDTLKELAKDLVNGMPYECTIDFVTKEGAFASTAGGQSVFIDVEKEKKDSERLNIDGLTFDPGSTLTVVVRSINGSYYGSVVDYYVENLKAELFMQITEEKSAYLAKIESVNKGGYIANISGVRCFLPGSLAAANKITDFDSYVGKNIYVMVESYMAKKDIFIVSYKKYLENIMEQKIRELNLTKKYKGIVTGTKSFGVFIEWEDVYTGLLHKSELSEEEDVTKFHPGDEVEFYIKEVQDDNRLTLTFSEPLEKTIKIYEIENKIKEGEFPKFVATVKHKRNNGAFLEIPSLKSFAFMPADKAKGGKKKLKAGAIVDVKIYEVDPIAGKMFAMLDE